MTRHRMPTLLVLVSILIFSLGCANSSPVSPPDTPSGVHRASGAPDHGRMLWGLWEVRVDLENGTIEALPLRSADLHFNVVPLLKEGTPKSLLRFSDLLIDPSFRQLQVDVSLTHPFPTLPQVAGFDVRGILFTKGDAYDLLASDVTMTGPGEPRLVNADGYTRWWNPLEFIGYGMFSYQDGFFGTPKAVGGYQSNLAAYKYFADGVGALDSLEKLNIGNRGVFRAGSTNKRRYLINFGTEPSNYVIFNYAVDANWGLIPGFKSGGPPPNVPADFPLTANCPEPFRIRVSESSNTMTATTAGGTSGAVNLNIDVFDWQAADPLSSVPMEVSIVQVEAPQLGLGPVTATVVDGSGTGGQMSTYMATIAGGTSDKLEAIDLIVTATCSEGNYQNNLTYFLGDDPLQAYFLHRAKVLDTDTYVGWTHRYTKLLYPEQPNQGANLPDIAVYKKSGAVRAATVDQLNPDPNGDGGHHPDSINEWANDYDTYSLPEHYHMPMDMLSETGLWDDFRGICVSDTSTRFFFSNTNINDEYPTGETDPLYAYITWVSHTYLGNQAAEAWNTAFFSSGGYPRYWATDPCNGVSIGTDYIYSVFLYDVTDMAGPNPGEDPQRYIIFRWAPPYDLTDPSTDWQRPFNVQPNGSGPGYVDRAQPYNHRLAVDDSLLLDRFYILDSSQEIEVVDIDFTKPEFDGSYPVGTVTVENWPIDCTGIADIEVVQTKPLGTLRNHVAALIRVGVAKWRVWVFDYDQSQPLGSQAVQQWLSEEYNGVPCSMDACDDPIELHVLHKNGGLIYATVFRDYP